MQKRKILAFLGSAAKQSSNKKILNYIANAFEGEIVLDIYDEMEQLPHFNPDLMVDLPVTVLNLRKKIALADGLLFATPEYVFSLPGSLKNAIEWNVSTTLFSNKPAAIIVAAAAGEKALASLALILQTIEAKVSSTLLLKGMKGKFDDLGDIKEPEVVKSIHKLIHDLLETIESN